MGRTAVPGLCALLLVAGTATVGTATVEAQQEDARRVTLQQAIDVALGANPAMTRIETDVNLAEYDRLSAYGDFLPDLSLGYGFSNASTARLDPTQQSLTRTSYTLQLGASFDILDGFRRFSALESAREGVAAERARRRQTRYQTVLEVKQAFYDAVARRELVRVEQDRVDRQEDQLEFVRQQMEVGRATRSDLLRSQVDLNNARLSLLNAENDARAATFALARSMGVRERVAPAEEATLAVDSLDYDRRQLMEMALERGPTVTSARAASEAAEAEIATARSSYLPNLRFQGGWAWQNSDFPPENRSWSLSLQGSYPLFDGFQRETRVYRARARATAAEAQATEAELQLRADLDAAHSQVQSARAGVELAEQTVELSREDLRLTQERFRLGLATILDLQSAQIALREAEAELVQRRFDHRIGLARLEALVGRNLEASPGTPTSP